MIRPFLCAGLIGLFAVPGFGQVRWVDDFETYATYDSAAIVNCTAKYTSMEPLTGDFNLQYVASGDGVLRGSTLKLGSFPGIEARFVFCVVGVLNVRQPCASGWPFLHSSETFDPNGDICMYSGFSFNQFQLRHASFGLGDDNGEEFGPDLDEEAAGHQNGPGVWNVDDDGNGTTDDPQWGGGSGNVIASPEYLWPGIDGAPGFAGQDDDGDGYTDYIPGPNAPGVDDDKDGEVDEVGELRPDMGEFGWPGSDDSDDTTGEWGYAAGLRANLIDTSVIFVNVDVMSDGNQFTIRQIYQSDLPSGPSDFLGVGFYEAGTKYNFVYCASGTCYGALLWTESDMANPNHNVGPVLNTLHNEPDSVNVAPGFWNYLNGEYAFIQNTTYRGNSNFDHSFWVVEGSPSQYYPSASADLDNDLDVDGQDFLTFSVCYNGSLNPPQVVCPNTDADLDDDGDVDGQDFLTFSVCYNGALKRPACLPSLLSSLAVCVRADNDECSGAIEISESDTPVTDELTFTSTSTVPCAWINQPPCIDPNKGCEGELDVWYKYVPTCTGTATIDLCATNTASNPCDDTQIVLYDDCPDNGGNVIGTPCDDNDLCTTGNYEIRDVAVTVGVPVYIAVQGEEPGDHGEFVLTIVCTP